MIAHAAVAGVVAHRFRSPKGDLHALGLRDPGGQSTEDFCGGDPIDHARFFDFLLIGFVLAFVVRDWHLTYGQSALILFSSDVAAVPGAIFFGWLGDKVGRRMVFMITVVMFSLATGAMALTPDRGWVYLTVMGFIVEVGVVGVAAVDMPLLQEFVPAAKRLDQRGVDRRGARRGMLAATFATYLGGVNASADGTGRGSSPHRLA